MSNELSDETKIMIAKARKMGEKVNEATAAFQVALGALHIAIAGDDIIATLAAIDEYNRTGYFLGEAVAKIGRTLMAIEDIDPDYYAKLKPEIVELDRKKHLRSVIDNKTDEEIERAIHDAEKHLEKCTSPECCENVRKVNNDLREALKMRRGEVGSN